MPRPPSPATSTISASTGPTSRRCCSATTGSDHGYDVVDPAQVDPARGGAAGLERFARRRARRASASSSTPSRTTWASRSPRENPWWWDVLDARARLALRRGVRHRLGVRRRPGARADPRRGARRGRRGRRAHRGSDAARRSRRSARCATSTTCFRSRPAPLDGLDAGDVPRRARPSALGAGLLAATRPPELNYRRFFTITTLAGVRVEVPWVFDETHAEILRWVREGLADGLRVDHPDGLVDPGGYLERLARGDRRRVRARGEDPRARRDRSPERLPAWWHTDGTTGYDAMAEIDRVLIDPGGGADAGRSSMRPRAARAARAPAPAWADLIHDDQARWSRTRSRRPRCGDSCAACPTGSIDRARRRTRSPSCSRASRCTARTCRPAPDGSTRPRPRHPPAAPISPQAIAALVPVLADPAREVARRFQQTTGPVMAKGVEDMAFYRQTRLGSLTEVGGDPSRVRPVGRRLPSRAGRSPGELAAHDDHAVDARHQARRGRARPAVGHRRDPARRMGRRSRAGCALGRRPVTARSTALLFQAAIGAWPISRERLHAYAEKAAREGGGAHQLEGSGCRVRSAACTRFVDAIFDDAVLHRLDRRRPPTASRRTAGRTRSRPSCCSWPDRVFPTSTRGRSCGRPRSSTRTIGARSTSPCGAGCSPSSTRVARSRRSTRPARRSCWSPRARCDCGGIGPSCSRRYTPMTVVGEASGHAIAFDRGGVVAVATQASARPRAARRLGRRRRCCATPVPPWTCSPAGGSRGTELALRDLLSVYPVALLAPEEVA